MPDRARVLLIGGSPEPSSLSTVMSASSGCDHIVVADRGLDVAMSAGLRPDLFCGDADSVSTVGAAVVNAAESDESGLSFEVERHDPYKDATDLSLAFDAIYRRWGVCDVVCTCLSGGRPDHFLAVMGCLSRQRRAQVSLAEDGFTARFLSDGDTWALPDVRGRRFSCIALSEGAVVSERGFRWELDHERLSLLDDLGVSNYVVAPDALVACHEGSTAAFLFEERSQLA